jgi:predicted RNA binding protein YcfA (HicA-like mRNA interferase family)
MPKLTIIASKKLIKILEKLGFQIDRTTGSHFIFYNPKTKKRAVVPYHKKDLPKGTLMSIIEEAGISKKDLMDLLKGKK